MVAVKKTDGFEYWIMWMLLIPLCPPPQPCSVPSTPTFVGVEWA